MIEPNNLGESGDDASDHCAASPPDSSIGTEYDIGSPREVSHAGESVDTEDEVARRDSSVTNTRVFVFGDNDTTSRAEPDSIAPSPPMIANFRIGELIGRGGMGSVMLAEQLNPVRRFVALKIIHGSRCSEGGLLRFETERIAMAMMDHPHIAKIYDAGQTCNGIPYLAMEWVRGIPLTKYCSEKDLPWRDRVDLFCRICDGVQHAHQKGVIHRDLKPTNILVTEVDGRPIPKIIDFGLAKAFSEDSISPESLDLTQEGQVLGTLRYMSPEQAAGGDSIDTRTDIFALGIILFELLTGTTPMQSGMLKNRPREEVLSKIRNQEPVRPSVRLSELLAANQVAAKSSADGASSGSFSSRRLRSDLASDLDWIVLKAMDPDRERRYASAAELASDARGYLGGLPVIARPPSVAYRTRKILTKYRRAALMIATLASTILVATIVAGVFARREYFARKNAEAERLRSQELQALAETSLDQAVEAIDQFVQMADDPRMLQPSNETLRRDLYAWSRNYFGEIAKTRPTGQLPWSFQRRQIHSQISLAILESNFRESANAKQILDDAAEQLKDSKLQNQPDAGLLLAEIQRSQGMHHYNAGNFEAALQRLQRALQTLSQIPNSDDLADTPTPSGAVARNRNLIETVHVHLGIAQTHYALRDLESCEASLRQAREIAESVDVSKSRDLELRRLSHLGNCYVLLARAQRLWGHQKQSLRLQEQAKSYLEQVAEFEGSIDHRAQIFDAKLNLVRLLQDVATLKESSQVNQVVDAEADWREAIALEQEITNHFTGVPRFYNMLARLRYGLGVNLCIQKKIKESLEHLEIAEKLYDRYPIDPGEEPIEYAYSLWPTTLRGNALMLLQRVEEAEPLFRKIEERIDNALADRPNDFFVTACKLQWLKGYGHTLANLGRDDEATKIARQLIDVGQGHFGGDVAWDGLQILALVAIDSENPSKRAETNTNPIRDEVLEVARSIADHLQTEHPGLDIDSLEEPGAFKSFFEPYRFHTSFY
ncbi:MAG: protein kinase [Planctomycetota bacterium]